MGSKLPALKPPALRAMHARGLQNCLNAGMYDVDDIADANGDLTAAAIEHSMTEEQWDQLEANAKEAGVTLEAPAAEAPAEEELSPQQKAARTRAANAAAAKEAAAEEEASSD